MDWVEIGRRFREPIPSKMRDGRGGKQFAYIDARDVQDRLDDVVGPGNWSCAFKVLQLDPPAVECTLTVCDVRKADVGYCNDPAGGREDEPLKAAYSDALKRAAVHWGIGRFLYEDAAPAQTTSTPRRAPTAATSTPMPQSTAIDGERKCADCGAVLEPVRFKDGTEWTAEMLAGYGKRKHGRWLCMDHYKAANDAKRAAA